MIGGLIEHDAVGLLLPPKDKLRVVFLPAPFDADVDGLMHSCVEVAAVGLAG